MDDLSFHLSSDSDNQNLDVAAEIYGNSSRPNSDNCNKDQEDSENNNCTYLDQKRRTIHEKKNTENLNLVKHLGSSTTYQEEEKYCNLVLKKLNLNKETLCCAV